MAGNYGANQYKQTQIKTANRGQILLMLYEAAIQNVKKAAVAIDNRDVAAKGLAIGKAHDIINELVTTLDFNIGGEVARNLERLYNFMTEQLVKANLENSKEKLQTVQKLLETLLEGWRVAVDQVNRSGGATPG
ncbi:MAG: flagellar export chaperone FliS [Oligoflexia bacterium]|nr:flagellar export chaperone FliS [Oligoflexia bacterium]